MVLSLHEYDFLIKIFLYISQQQKKCVLQLSNTNYLNNQHKNIPSKKRKNQKCFSTTLAPYSVTTTHHNPTRITKPDSPLHASTTTVTRHCLRRRYIGRREMWSNNLYAPLMNCTISVFLTPIGNLLFGVTFLLLRFASFQLYVVFGYPFENVVIYLLGFFWFHCLYRKSKKDEIFT